MNRRCAGLHSAALPSELPGQEEGASAPWWAGLDSNQQRFQRHRFTVCFLHQFGYRPIWRSREGSNLQGWGTPNPPAFQAGRLPLSHCCRLSAQKAGSPGNTLRMFFWRQGWDSNPQLPREHRFSKPTGCQLPHPARWRRGGDSNSHAPKEGRDGLAIRCLTIGLTSPDDYKEYSYPDPPEADQVDQKRIVCNFNVPAA